MPWFSLFFKCYRAPSLNREVDDEVSGIQNTKLYKYEELVKATADFSRSNKIGHGGFGSVYKGVLEDGTLVAVKVLSAESSQGVREFLTEINMIANIEHPNLVKLHGCCVEGEHRILVYGYLENNSLSQTLLGGSHSSIQFQWPTRREIAIGVAMGLAFLHEEVQPPIIHRDIKASNILLDRHLEPIISDFGLAKLFPSNMTHISTRVAGTVGYLAPEYAMRGQLTNKADIYSFGVLLLEIVSGRCNTNRKLPAEERYLLETAWKLHEKGELMSLVDASLDGEHHREEACLFMKIGLLCAQGLPRLRPSMSTVVNMLMGLAKVNDNEISRPGSISDFMSLIAEEGLKAHSKDSSSPASGESSGPDKSSLWSKDMPSSCATMTFNSIYDRSI
ncbi:cold-responsive protein kinase 1-like [Syzygium oleosum]|uniref:cold-responsive protein kinase 1-like n=1 Tax=Syzygium oleosum TaxID=219896 RepID=UPI0011D296BF|nr:cold-responsive protein kinase 1-like [Syzygium oleosum]XP_030445008.1 cold-responsive protein kinase 1-like [Syzygium oleosum]XP_030445012.1 cold-responsive protein kinase 1-like [Syzygium oleosum]XP_056167729.1 cold-responsive protein kinase 1-like [Syzygium oleosum]